MEKSVEFSNEEVLKVTGSGTRVVATIAAVVMLSVASVGAIVGTHEGRLLGNTHAAAKSDGILYGSVRNIPKEIVGIWTVDGRKMAVTADTVIRVKRGKLETGAFIKVEGGMPENAGNMFIAREIDVEWSPAQGDTETAGLPLSRKG